MNNATQSTAAIVREITKVKRTGETLRARVQRTGVMIMVHAIKHGDWSKANDLVEALGNGVNGKALVSWFVDNLGLIVDPEQGKFTGWNGKEHAKANLEKAKKTPWFSHKTESAFAGYDLEKQLESMLNQAQKMLDRKNKALAEGDAESADKIVVNYDVMEKLRAIKAA